MQLKHTTLCYLIKDGQVLLAMKKRGHGEGKWNGVGGKLLPNETPQAAAIREAEEEVGVTPTELEKIAETIFLYPEMPAETRFNQLCHIFICRKWIGEPQESEEMRPQWYSQDTLPLEAMWDSDSHWLHQALAGQPLIAEFSFDADYKMTNHKVTLNGTFSHPLTS